MAPHTTARAVEREERTHPVRVVALQAGRELRVIGPPSRGRWAARKVSSNDVGAWGGRPASKLLNLTVVPIKGHRGRRRSAAYDLQFIVDYVNRFVAGDALAIVLGDHQPGDRRRRSPRSRGAEGETPRSDRVRDGAQGAQPDSRASRGVRYRRLAAQVRPVSTAQGPGTSCPT
jgi:hypothetical protein